MAKTYTKEELFDEIVRVMGCEQNKKMLKADIILVSDTSMISMQTPSITCGLRGLAYIALAGPVQGGARPAQRPA